MRKKVMKLFIAPLILLFFIQPVLAQETGIQFVEDKSWQEILALSKKLDKPIFLDCYTVWCAPCKAMAKEVFPLKEVGDFMNQNFINVKLDMEKGEGIDLYNKYKEYIPGFPTFLLFNSKGEIMHQVAGYTAADKFILKMKDGLKENTWIAYSTKYKAGERDWNFLQSYLKLLEDAFQTSVINEVTQEILPKLTIEIISNDSSAYKIFRKYWNTTDGDILFKVLSSPGLYRKYKDTDREINDWAGRIYGKTINQYIKSSTTPDKFDQIGAKAITDELRQLSVTSRENMIALMLLSKAVANKDGNEFLRLYHSATELGHLRFNDRHIGDWATYLAGFTSNKDQLKKYLACLKFSENKSSITYREYRNYAIILEKLGEKEKAKGYYKKADVIEAEMAENYKEFFNK